MRDGIFRVLKRRHSSSLTVRGGALRTFATLAAFAVLVLLGGGGYLIAAQFANPVEAQPGLLLLAAFLITTAVTLIGPLLQTTRMGFRLDRRRTR